MLQWFMSKVRAMIEADRRRQANLAQLQLDIEAAAERGAFNWTTPAMRENWIGFRRSATA